MAVDGAILKSGEAIIGRDGGILINFAQNDGFDAPERALPPEYRVVKARYPERQATNHR